jgi:hypothetical protein
MKPSSEWVSEVMLIIDRVQTDARNGICPECGKSVFIVSNAFLGSGSVQADPSFYNPEYDAGPGDCIPDMPLREPYVSFRDRCAIAAMQGMIVNPRYLHPDDTLSKAAFKIADAMVAQRDKKP